jgi:hypothetical protein
MKKKLLFAAVFMLVAASFTSCEKNCKTCQQNTYVDGTLETSGDSQEYCGVALTVIEATDDVTIGQTTTKWECN